MILFFETYSFIQVALLYRHIRTAQKIYFHKILWPPTLRQALSSKTAPLVVRLIRWIAPHCDVEEVPDAIVRSHNWTVNRRSVELTQRAGNLLKEWRIFRNVLSIVRDPAIVKFHQHLLSADVASRLLFFAVAKDLRKQCAPGQEFCLVPAEHSDGLFQEELDGPARKSIPGIVHTANTIRLSALKFALNLAIVVSPIVLLGLHIRRLRFRKRHGHSYQLAMQVVYGFHSEERITYGTKRLNDDGYLYGPKLQAGDIVHVFTRWRDHEAEFKKAMSERGLPYADAREFAFTWRFLVRILAIQFRLLAGLPKSLLDTRAHYAAYVATLFAIKAIFEKYLELENLNYKVVFVKDDYDPNHVISTILCKQDSRSTVGIQHHIAACQNPAFSFVHFDRYIVYGDIHVRSFAPYWNGLRLEKTGRETIDHIVQLKNDPARLSEIRKRIEQLHQSRRYNAVFVLPSPYGLSRIHYWDELYKALLTLSREALDCNVFLRFRTLDDLESPYTSRFKDLVRQDPRFIINQKDFATLELMVVSDLVICNSASFGIWEAVAADLKVFTLDFSGIAKYYFPDYGKDFILDNREDVLRAMYGLRTNFSDFDCDWQRLKRECNYHDDGRNMVRIQSVVTDLIEETRGKSGS